jgi:hypothetical protein
MQNFPAIVVPFQKQINEQASTFSKFVGKMSILAVFGLFFRVVLDPVLSEATEKISHFREIAT